MQYCITEQQLPLNVNSQFGINSDLQRVLANGNAQFVIELARELKLSYTIPSIALHMSLIFFHKKCYINWDRFVVLAACVLLASKLKDMDCRLKMICNSFYNIISRLTRHYQPYNEQKMKKIKEQICIYESQILRTLQYDVDFISPHQYVRKYCDLFFIENKQCCKLIYNSTRVLIMDSYRCRCCLLFRPIIIFISCFLIASRYQAIRPYENNIIKDLCKEDNLNLEKLYLTWLKFISEKEKQIIKEKDIQTCIYMINQIIIQ